MISAWHQQDKRASKQPRTNFGEKCCSACKEVKKASEFNSDASRVDGIDAYCKICRKLRVKPKAKPSPEALRKRKIKQCHERLAFWTNELNKAQKDGM